MLRIAIISFLTVASLYVRAQGSIQIEISFPEKAMKGKKIIKSVEYVPLETTSDCLIGESAWFYITNEYIVIAHFFEGKALLFDRKTGRFIHEIGRAGQGPGEYTGFWAANGFNEKEQLLYMHEWHQWKAYDIQTGKLKQIIKSPGEKYVIQNPYLYKQGVYLGYANNTTGKVPYKLIAFDKEGKISKIYPQYNQIELNLAKGEYPMNVGLFYEFDSNVYFQEANTDSVFQVTDEVLEPHICFKHPKEISFPEIWGETTHYVVSRFRMKEHAYIAIYDKKEKDANLICAKINHTNLFSQISNNIIMFIIAGFIAIFIYAILLILVKKLKLKITLPDNINEKSKNQIIEVSVISSVLILINEISLFEMLNILPTAIYFLAIIVFICYYIITVISINKTVQIENEKSKVSELEGSNTRLKESFDDICSFRHDMKNIMQGLGGYIAAKDIDGLTNMYNEFICDCKGVQNRQDFDKIAKSNPAIYNIINNKYLEAKKDGINITVEIYTDLNGLKIKTYELCRVLGILIDNAIEATKECNNKQIWIKFIKDNYNNRNLVIIENPCKNTLLDLSKLKEKGFTTKKDKIFHGLGLWRVNQIIKKNENLRLATSREEGNIFKQQLEIYNWK